MRFLGKSLHSLMPSSAGTWATELMTLTAEQDSNCYATTDGDMLQRPRVWLEHRLSTVHILVLNVCNVQNKL
jgi:hypothetical protein